MRVPKQSSFSPVPLQSGQGRLGELELYGEWLLAQSEASFGDRQGFPQTGQDQVIMNTSFPRRIGMYETIGLYHLTNRHASVSKLTVMRIYYIIIWTSQSGEAFFDIGIILRGYRS